MDYKGSNTSANGGRNVLRSGGTITRRVKPDEGKYIKSLRLCDRFVYDEDHSKGTLTPYISEDDALYKSNCGIYPESDGYYTFKCTATDLANWGSQYDSFLATGPLLRLGGTSMTNVKTGSSSFDGVNPRSMIGKTQDGTVYMVVVEGRIAKADGLRIENMVNLAEDLGLVDAINLDGGGSSTLWVNGVGVVNRLSGGSVRRVPNILIAK